MAWGAYKYIVMAFVPVSLVGAFLDLLSPLLSGGEGETYMLDRWQFSADGNQPYAYAGVNLPVVLSTKTILLDAFATGLSGVKYYIIDAETGLLLNTSSTLTVGQACTWANAVSDVGLQTISSPTSLSSLASIWDFDGITAPNTSGGNGGKALYVTNANNDGVGSLRMVSLLPYPRHIKFTEPVTINLSPNDIIAGGSLMLDGRDSAVCIRGATFAVYSDTIITNMRFRQGVVANPQTDDALRLSGSNIYIENTSITWGVDADVELDADDVIMKNCIIAEGLDGERTNGGGYQSKGIMSWSSADNVTLYRCLFHLNSDRNPVLYGGRWDIYNCLFTTVCYIDFEPRFSGVQANVIGNRYIPNTTSIISGYGYPWNFIMSYNTPEKIAQNQAAWDASGIYLSDNRNVSFPERTGLYQEGTLTPLVQVSPYTTNHVSIASLMAADADMEASVLASVGAFNNGVRDPVDQGIVDRIAARTFSFEPARWVHPEDIVYPDLSLL